MKTYLISHTNDGESGVAQATIRAKNEQAAVKKFSKKFPARVVGTVGRKA